MAIQSFLVFIGSLLASSIALAVVVKNLSEGFAVSGKKPFVYGSVAAILTSGAAYLASFVADNKFVVFWFLGGVFLVFGIIHILMIHNRYFYTYKTDSNKILWAEVLFGLSVIFLTIVVFSSLQYFLDGQKDFLFYPVLLSTLLFFVPLLVFHSFQAAYDIPATKFPTWEYPLHKPIAVPDEEEDRGTRKLVIAFEIANKPTDYKRTNFRAKGPETMKLGDLFYHVINENNHRYSQAKIEYTDKNHEPYEWWFRRKPKWYQAQKIFNPELSLRENGVRENTIIICERVLENKPIVNTTR